MRVSVLGYHGLLLCAMSSLAHVVFIWFHFKKRNEIKKKLRTENKHKEDENKMKTKAK